MLLRLPYIPLFLANTFNYATGVPLIERDQTKMLGHKSRRRTFSLNARWDFLHPSARNFTLVLLGALKKTAI